LVRDLTRGSEGVVRTKEEAGVGVGVDGVGQLNRFLLSFLFHQSVVVRVNKSHLDPAVLRRGVDERALDGGPGEGVKSPQDAAKVSVVRSGVLGSKGECPEEEIEVELGRGAGQCIRKGKKQSA
jgi:hypothetical protein